MRTLLILAALAATLTACGGADEEPASSTEDANRTALLEFAQCMREHGVDMPDPQFEGGRVTMTQRGGRDTSPEKMRAAEQACAKYRDKVKPPEGREPSDAQQAEFREQALAHAKCMREHGIDMPDPQFEENGVRMQVGPGIDPESQEFKDAQEACRDTLPEGGERR
jgi:hypothetical protein